jgi:hypothetical protein
VEMKPVPIAAKCISHTGSKSITMKASPKYMESKAKIHMVFLFCMHLVYSGCIPCAFNKFTLVTKNNTYSPKA